MGAKLHFDDCPYNCNEKGKILDVATGLLVDCPFCSKLRKELLAKGEAVEEDSNSTLPLSDLLGIKSKYLTNKYVSDVIIPDSEQCFLEEESIDFFKSVSEDIYHTLALGNVPKSSYCFGISIKGSIDKLAYPLLATAYLNGLTVGRFLTCSELSRLQLRGSDILDTLYDVDIVIVLIGEGSTKGEISCAKGLMQARALNGKPTLFITTWTIEACSLMLGYSTGEDNLFLAKPVFVKYKNSGKSSNYINKLTGVDNDRYDEETDKGGIGFSLSDL